MCQNTPAFRLPATAAFVLSTAFRTAKYWWYPAKILLPPSPFFEKHVKFRARSRNRSGRNTPLKNTS